MNPNSENQVWGRWTFRVYPERPLTKIPFESLRQVCAHKGRALWGLASQMRIEINRDGLILQVRSENQASQDPAQVRAIAVEMRRWFKEQFGKRTVVSWEHRFEAGSKQDGNPREQLIMLPSLSSMLKDDSLPIEESS